ncbi:MAG: glutamine synthetase III [Chitinophagales bacterium]|nr:glutamine synthetase III [Chitinophagales bacterium]
MATTRFNAIETALSRKPVAVKLPSEKISDFFAANVFSLATMRQYLSKEAYESVTNSIEHGQKIDRQIADQVAASMKAWAMSKGATSYTHWFQPLTGNTAEKHDTFFTPIDNSSGIEKFSGDALVQQEPDASSFPSGGLRVTFEARGYTAWDPSSPAFIVEVGTGKTLCIPTIFISYTGEALDYKAPLLKSQHFLEVAAVPVCQLFDRSVRKVTPTLGWEQEYFLVDAALFNVRPDLMSTGRTLLGNAAAKGQQLEDHYFASIPERVYAYMLDFETEAHKLGIPIKTRHNEVAPGQYECAPVFTDANLAVDQNQLLMDLMERIARRHNFRVLFHEKPFAGINGSGKHNNWSMGTDTGKNLLSPGKTPKTNLQFLTFFITIIKAVHEHSDLVRAAIASAGNEHRLGANEAPPAIISVFVGSTLAKLLDELDGKTVQAKQKDDTDEGKIDIHTKIPDVLLDNTDRNRTSPFAFTGNKFEFRAVGSSANCALPMTILNTIVAQQLVDFKTELDALLGAGEKRDPAILKILRRYASEAKQVLFEGDNYSTEWAEEAARRGLNNVKTTPEALDFFLTDKAKKLLTGNNIYSERELEARHEVQLEIYKRKLEIEAVVLTDMVNTQIIPAVLRYQNELIANLRGLTELGIKKKSLKNQNDLLETITETLGELKSQCDELDEAREKANGLDNAHKIALDYCHKVKPYFEEIRHLADRLEQITDDRAWPLPKYRELLFIK